MSEFARNVLKLGGGNVASQVISILAVPLITRLYAPEEFGAFSFVFSVVAVAFPLSTLRLNSAILLPREEKTALDLLMLSIGSVLISTLLVMPVVALILHGTASIDETIRAVLWFLVAGVLAHGLVHCLEFWLLRHKLFSLMAWGAVGESVADRLFVIVMGLTQSALASWLAVGRVVGSAVHLAIFMRPGRGLGISWRGSLRNGSLADTLRRYREFPLYTTWAYLFANGGRELPTILFAVLFSAAKAGMYALGVRVLSFPMLLIGDAVARVFLPYAVELAREPSRLLNSTDLLIRAAFYLIFPPMLLLCVLGPQLFVLVFGPEWIEAGRFAQILAPSFLVTFIYRVTGIFFDIFEKQKMRLAFDAAQLVGRIGGMMLGGLTWGVEGAVWGLLIPTLIAHGAAVLYLLSLIGLNAAASAALFGQALLSLLPLSVLLLSAGQLIGAGAVGWAIVVALIASQGLWLSRREPQLVGYARRWLG